MHAIWAATKCYAMTEHTTWMHAAPMFHAMDSFAIFGAVFAGGRQVCVRGSITGHRIVAFVQEHSVTATAMSAAMLSMVVAALGDAPSQQPALASLECVSAGGAPVPPKIWREFLAHAAPTTRALNDYGMTEACGKILVDGVATPLLEVRIVVRGEDGAFTNAASGAVGELAIRGVTRVRKSYWRRDDHAADDGFVNLDDHGAYLLTGDLARDENGAIAIVGRAKDMVLVGGENVYAAEVEGVLLEDDAVVEAAVVGRPDDILGEVVVAYAIVVPPPDDNAAISARLRARCAESLAPFKVPCDIHVAARGTAAAAELVPRNAMGKVDKHELRAREKASVDARDSAARAVDGTTGTQVVAPEDLDIALAAVRAALAAATDSAPPPVDAPLTGPGGLTSVCVARAAGMLADELCSRGWVDASLRVSARDFWTCDSTQSLALRVAAMRGDGKGPDDSGKLDGAAAAKDGGDDDDDDDDDDAPFGFWSVLRWIWVTVVLWWWGGVWLVAAPEMRVLPRGLAWAPATAAARLASMRARWLSSGPGAIVELALGGSVAPDTVEVALRAALAARRPSAPGLAFRVRTVPPLALGDDAVRPGAPTVLAGVASAELLVAKATRASPRVPAEWAAGVAGDGTGGARTTAVLSLVLPSSGIADALALLHDAAAAASAAGSAANVSRDTAAAQAHTRVVSPPGTASRVDTRAVQRFGAARLAWHGLPNEGENADTADVAAATVAAHLSDAAKGAAVHVRLAAGDVVLPPRAAIAPPMAGDAAAIMRAASCIAKARCGGPSDAPPAHSPARLDLVVLPHRPPMEFCGVQAVPARVSCGGARAIALEVASGAASVAHVGGGVRSPAVGLGVAERLSVPALDRTRVPAGSLHWRASVAADGTASAVVQVA